MFMHFFFHSHENNIHFSNRPHPGAVFTKKRKEKPVVKYLINYNVYSNTAIHIFILKYTSLDIMQQQQVPLQKKSNKIIIIIIKLKNVKD